MAVNELKETDVFNVRIFNPFLIWFNARGVNNSNHAISTCHCHVNQQGDGTFPIVDRKYITRLIGPVYVIPLSRDEMK